MMVAILQTGMICATLLALAFFVLLALPESRLRGVFKESLSWCTAGACAVYVVFPIDFIPDFIPVLGWIDDLVVLILGITAAVSAYGTRKRQSKLKSRRQGAIPERAREVIQCQLIERKEHARV
jgi:uncharacterized membrane protein YkvA (DUF1232 family)